MIRLPHPRRPCQQTFIEIINEHVNAWNTRTQSHYAYLLVLLIYVLEVYIIKCKPLAALKEQVCHSELAAKQYECSH